MENSKKYKYIAFISYRHTDPDFDIGAQIHREIESFSVPKSLDSEGKYKEMRVFRDREELTTKDLSDSLDEALRQSEYLIVVCSRRTPESIWCTQEVEKFRAYHKDDTRIIPVLIEGEPHESFSQPLQNLKSTYVDDKGQVQERELELLAADLRPDEVKDLDFVGYEVLEETDKARLNQLKKESIKILKSTEIYRIMATILGVNFGDLRQRHKERRNRMLLSISAIVAGVFLVFGLAMTNLYFRAEEARRVATEQTALMTLNTADRANEEGDRLYAMLIADKAMEGADPRMDGIDRLEGNYHRILNDALLSPPYSSVYMLEPGADLALYTINDEKDRIITAGDTNNLLIYDMNNGRILEDIAFDAPLSAILEVKESSDILVATDDLKLYRLDGQSFQKDLVIENTNININQMGVFGEDYLVLDKRPYGFEFYNLHDMALIRSKPIENIIESSLNELYNLEDGYFIGVYRDGRILIENINDENYSQEIEGPGQTNIRVSALSKDKKTFAYTGERNQIYICDLGTLESRPLGDYVAKDMKFLENGELAFISALMKAAYIINPQTAEVSEYFMLDFRPKAFDYDETTGLLALVAETTNEVYLVDRVMEGYEREYNLALGSASDTETFRVDFVNDGKNFITSSVDASIKYYTTDSILSDKALPGEIGAISADRNILFFVYDETSIGTYNFQTGESIYIDTVSEKFSSFMSVYAVSNDGGRFAFSSLATNSAGVFGPDGYLIYETRPHAKSNIVHSISDIKFSEEAGHILTMNSDGVVFVSDIETGDFIRELKDKDEVASHILLSEDGSLVCICYTSSKSSIIDVETGDLVDEIQGEVYSIEGQGGDLISARGQYGSRLFNYENSSYSYYASNDERSSFAGSSSTNDFVSKDGNYLISTTGQGDTILTDLRTGYRIRTLPTKAKAYNNRGVISSDSQYLAYQYSPETIIVSKNYSIEELEDMSAKALGQRTLTDEEMLEIGIIRTLSDQEDQ